MLVKTTPRVVAYIGTGGMLFTFLTATPLHDMIIVFSSTTFLVSIVYITGFVLRTKIHLLELLGIVCLLLYYSSL